MDDSKIQRLKELKNLYQSGVLTQDEFETTKRDILSEDSTPTEPIMEPRLAVETKKSSPRKQNRKHPKQSHKIRNFILFVCLLGLFGAGGYFYFNQQDNGESSSASSGQKRIATSKLKSKSRKNDTDENKKKSVSSSQSKSSESSQVSNFSQDNDAVEMFHSLDQKRQLATMYSFAVLKDEGSDDTSWVDASIINADLNTENTIVLSPMPGDTRIILTDNHDETFDYEIYHVDSVVDEGTVTTTQLNSIAQNDTQINTWRAYIRLKDYAE